MELKITGIKKTLVLKNVQKKLY